MSEKEFIDAAKIIVKAGVIPFPVSDTLINVLKFKLNKDDLDLIIAFKRKLSQTMEQLKKSSGMSEEEIIKKAEKLAEKGLMFIASSSSGVVVYRLLPVIMAGLFEYSMMRKLTFSEDEKKLAKLFDDLLNETKKLMNDKYDFFKQIFEKLPPLDRTIPILGTNVSGNEIQITINKEVEAPSEKVLPTYRVEELIKKFDDIAVGNCFCRQHMDLLGNPCEITDLRENCLIFGKSARFTNKQGFARLISKEEALEILKKSEEAGLVHKAFHPRSDIYRDEDSVCNCCEDCCINFQFWRAGALPIINSTNYLSRVDEDLCIGCGTCVEKCPVKAIILTDGNFANIQEERCIGCGICAHFCPEGAISFLEGMRKVFFPPLSKK